MEDWEYLEESLEPFRFPFDFLHCYSDGSEMKGAEGECRAGCGVVSTTPNFEPLCFRFPGPQTNNRAEIWAAIAAIRKTSNIPMVLHTDSALVWHFILHKYRREYLVRFAGNENSDDLMELANAIFERTAPLWCIKVRGHVGNEFNELADEQAKLATKLPSCDVYTYRRAERPVTPPRLAIADVASPHPYIPRTPIRTSNFTLEIFPLPPQAPESIDRSPRTPPRTAPSIDRSLTGESVSPTLLLLQQFAEPLPTSLGGGSQAIPDYQLSPLVSPQQRNPEAVLTPSRWMFASTRDAPRQASYYYDDDEDYMDELLRDVHFD